MIQQKAFQALKELPKYADSILTVPDGSKLEQMIETLCRIHAVYFAYVKSVYDLIVSKEGEEKAIEMIRNIDQTTQEAMLYMLLQDDAPKLALIEKLTGRSFEEAKKLILGISPSEEQLSS